MLHVSSWCHQPKLKFRVVLVPVVLLYSAARCSVIVLFVGPSFWRSARRSLYSCQLMGSQILLADADAITVVNLIAIADTQRTQCSCWKMPLELFQLRIRVWCRRGTQGCQGAHQVTGKLRGYKGAHLFYRNSLFVATAFHSVCSRSRPSRCTFFALYCAEGL